MTGVTNSVGGDVQTGFTYRHNLLGNVTNRNNDAFSYNLRSEVSGAVVGSNVFNYAYDGIGNNTTVTRNAVAMVYTANCLNQYTAIAGGSAASPVYDADGNLLSFGPFSLTWDAENRNSAVLSNGVTLVASGYDPQHRRVVKTTPSQTHIFLYDGWLPVLEKIIRADGTTEMREHVWGKDLSGTRGGAGGIGGLLATRIGDTWYFPLYDDANGNITDYVDADGTVVAHREYDPFGNTIVASGSMANDFNFWFSTKYLDHETGFYDYGRRLYSSELKRFLNRDPISEDGGLNLYEFVGNNPMNRWDYLGLTDVKGWNKSVLSNAEGHNYGCPEWKCHEEGFSGVANRSSYVRHFEVKSLGAINMDTKLKRTLADELVTSIGISNTDEATLWAMNFRETALYYTDYKKKEDSKCKSGCRYYIDILMQVVVSEIRSRDSDMIETLVFTNNGNETKNKIGQTAIHSIDKECVP